MLVFSWALPDVWTLPVGGFVVAYDSAYVVQKKLSDCRSFLFMCIFVGGGGVYYQTVDCITDYDLASRHFLNCDVGIIST